MTDRSGKASYPKRPSHFAHKFCRLLTKAAVAQRIGPEACWLLAVIVHQEDAVLYRRPVDFYNEQLMALCGFGGRSRLVTARRKAVDAGWLHYTEGGKGRPGTYWVQVADGHQDITDTPCDESVSRPKSGQQTELAVPNQDGKPPGPPNNGVPKQDGKRTANGRQTDGKPAPSNPIPNPSPSPKKARALSGFGEWYSHYPRKVARQRAEKAYPNAVKRISESERCSTDEAEQKLLDVVRLFAESDIGKGDRKFIPHPSTWLNDARYEDNPQEWTRHDGNGRQVQQDSPARIR